MCACVLSFHFILCYLLNYYKLDKNISNYLIRAYKELYKGISIVFEAVPISIVTKISLISVRNRWIGSRSKFKSIKSIRSRLRSKLNPFLGHV